MQQLRNITNKHIISIILIMTTIIMIIKNMQQLRQHNNKYTNRITL